MAVVGGVFAALLGLAVGSFLNVVVHRVPRGESIARPPSSCPSCGAPIGATDNIPVLSYLKLRGRCRRCGSRISPRYPLIEISNGALWLAAFLRFRSLEQAAFVAVVSSVLLALTAIDLEVQRLPNVIVLPATAIALVWIAVESGVSADLTPFLHALMSGVGAFLMLLVIALVSGGMGFGDVKLAALIGLAAGRFGWQSAVVAIFAGFFVGGAVAVGLLVAKRRGRKDRIPFGPSLAAGCVIGMFGGRALAALWLGTT